jgi:hypothetical protein
VIERLIQCGEGVTACDIAAVRVNLDAGVTRNRGEWLFLRSSRGLVGHGEAGVIKLIADIAVLSAQYRAEASRDPREPAS